MALADAFAEPVERAFQDLQGQFRDKVDVPPGRRFVGLDAYEKAIAAGADLVLLCTPPGFRPAQFAAAVKAGKNVFMEKPVAVDAPGYRVVKAANAGGQRRRGSTSPSATTCATTRTTRRSSARSTTG